jgi:hypothetical protein
MRECCADLAEFIDFIGAPLCLRLLFGGVGIAHCRTNGDAERERAHDHRNDGDDHHGADSARFDETHALVRHVPAGPDDERHQRTGRGKRAGKSAATKRRAGGGLPVCLRVLIMRWIKVTSM